MALTRLLHQKRFCDLLFSWLDTDGWEEEEEAGDVGVEDVCGHTMSKIFEPDSPAEYICLDGENQWLILI